MSVILQKAISSHQKGNINEAYQLYLQHLKQYPEDIQAYALLGSLLFNQGQCSEAIKAFKVIYQYKPGDCQNLQQLVQCYAQIGEPMLAQQYLNKLIELAGLTKDTLKLQILLHKIQMKTAEAISVLKSYLNQHSHDYDVWLMMGDLLSEIRDYNGAIEAFSKAVALKPNANVARHNLALAYRLAGKPEVALQHYQKVLKAGNDSFQLMHNLGNAYADLGRLEEAVKYYEKALSKNLAYVDSHKNLNALYWELNNQDKFLQSYLKAIQAYPDEFVFVAAYVGSLLRVKRYDEALQKLDSSRQRFNALPEWQSLTLICQVALQQLTDASKTLQSIDLNIHITAANVNVMAEIAEQAIELKQFDIAFKLTEGIHHVFPTHQLSLSLLGLCLRHYENTRYQQLVNYSQHVREFSLFDMTIREDCVFVAELLSQLKSLHTASQQPLEQTLRGGTQTKGKLFSLENAVIQKLKEKIENAINSYIRSMSTEIQHIFPKPDENQFEFSGSWSVRLKEEGYHSNHIHPEGWLSSVFYVELPDDVEDEQNKAGWLKFGEPNLSQKHDFSPEKYVKPQVGKLVLFPSYYWHGTVPFHSSSFRTTVAFDVALKQ